MRTYIVDALTPLVGPTAASIIAPTWFTMVALGAVACALLTLRAARRAGENERTVATALAWAYAAGILGGIVGPAVFDLAVHWVQTGRVRLRWAGMTSFAGLVCAVGAAILYLRARGNIRLSRFADLGAAPVGVGLAIGRLGCFVAGCDYGKVTSLPWAMRFPSGSSAWRDHVDSGWLAAHRAESLPVHPTQLYEALLGVALYFWARRIENTEWARQRHGRVFLAVGVAYAVVRFGIEILRGDTGRGFVSGLSTGQVSSLLLAVCCAAALWRLRPPARLSTAAAAAALALIVTTLPAHAQPTPTPPVTTAPAPAPAPPSGPVDPYATAPAPAPAPTGEQRQLDWELSVMAGASSPFNRRSEQVPALAGGAFRGTLFLPQGFGLGIDVDSMASSVAGHRSLLLSGETRLPIRKDMSFGLRVGLGGTVIDFDEPTFQDVLALGFRVQGIYMWWISERWALVGSPLAIDVISHSEVGGVIASYQARIGVMLRLR